MVGAVAVVLVLGTVGLVSSLTGDDGAAGTGTGEALLVTMTDFAFDPDPITFAGDAAQLLVVNDGQVEHNLVIPELGKGTPEMLPGDDVALDLTDQAPGTYRVICDIPGHVEAGMETAITIG